MSAEQFSKLSEALTVREYEEGETIIRQGEQGREFFVVLSGECVAEIETGWFISDIQEHKRYHSGELFGELALLEGKPRAASIRACSYAEVLVLSRTKFERL